MRFHCTVTTCDNFFCDNFSKMLVRKQLNSNLSEHRIKSASQLDSPDQPSADNLLRSTLTKSADQQACRTTGHAALPVPPYRCRTTGAALQTHTLQQPAGDGCMCQLHPESVAFCNSWLMNGLIADVSRQQPDDCGCRGCCAGLVRHQC